MKAASATLDEMPKPSQARKIGAKATFGMVSMATRYGNTARSPKVNSPTSTPSVKPIASAMAKP